MSTPGTPQEDPVSRSSGGGDAGPPGPGREVSEEERGGVGDTDTEPEPALGVGEHITRAGESLAGQDTGEEGRTGPARRPLGRQPDESGISEQEGGTDSPVAGEPGDQGG